MRFHNDTVRPVGLKAAGAKTPNQGHGFPVNDAMPYATAVVIVLDYTPLHGGGVCRWGVEVAAQTVTAAHSGFLFGRRGIGSRLSGTLEPVNVLPLGITGSLHSRCRQQPAFVVGLHIIVDEVRDHE